MNTTAKALGVRQAAQELGVTTKYVYDLLYSGRLPGAAKVGRTWRIPPSQIRQRLKARKDSNG